MVSEILLLGKKYIRNIINIDIGILIKNAVSQSKYSTIRLPHRGPITPPSSAEAPINPNPYIQYFFSKIKDTPTMQIGIMAPDELFFIFMIVGLGFGIYIVPIHNAGLNKIPEKIRGISSSMISFSRMIGIFGYEFGQ